MNRLTITTTVLAALAGSAHAQNIGPFTHPETGVRYYRSVSASRPAAAHIARLMGGTLATIHNAQTNEWIRANVAAAGGNTLPCLIGLNDIQAEGSYVWDNEEKSTYLNWTQGEPNNQGDEDAVVMSPVSGRWNDVPVSSSFQYIYEVTGPIRVPIEFTTIQAAINAAVDGQTIIVGNGTFTENLHFMGKRITLRSANGPALTTIRVPAVVMGIDMYGQSGATLEGFTIVPAAGGTSNAVVFGNGQVIHRCRIRNPDGTGVLMLGSGTLSDTLIAGSQFAVVAGSPGGRVDGAVQNCTLAGNVRAIAAIGGANGPPVTVRLINSITAGNIGPFGADSGANIFFNSNVIAEGPVGGPNLHADPGFVNAPGPDGLYDLTDDYRLRPDSLSIDVGHNGLRRPFPATAVQILDLAGSPRFIDHPGVTDTGAGPGPFCDAGAYEFVYTPPAPPACPADFNGDGFLDFFDLDAYVEAFDAGC
ncbi:MAG: hypothetical protein HRU70_02985 [Phycisphaeraceae bacterium]|nr:MAG: hypothetical protein HRU70_02985 [Phycisphaeraceae bacterium]